MKQWYLTRDGIDGIWHEGQLVGAGQKIELTEEQAKVHGDKLVKSKPPDDFKKAEGDRREKRES